MHELLQVTALVLKGSIILQVLAVGLGATWVDATYMFRQPKLLWNSILARNVAVPIIAILLIKAFSIHGAMAIAIAVLSVTPVPPLLPKSQLKTGARSEYVLGLLVSQTLLAIVIVPLTIRYMDWVFGAQVHFRVWEVIALMAKTILLPLGVGMLAGQLLPALRRFAQPITMAGTVLLLLGILPLIPFAWKMFGTLSGSGTMLALALFVIATTAAGHFLGGPNPEDRTALAMATSARHPAVALAIAKKNFPEHTALVSGAVVIYLIFRVILSIPYTSWRHMSPNHTPRHS